MKTRFESAGEAVPMKPILFRTAAGCLAAWLLAAPAPAVAPAETAAVATATAVESLVRATRKPAEREPFRLEAGPADPQAEDGARDELEQAIMLIQEKDYAAATPLLAEGEGARTVATQFAKLLAEGFAVEPALSDGLGA